MTSGRSRLGQCINPYSSWPLSGVWYHCSWYPSDLVPGIGERQHGAVLVFLFPLDQCQCWWEGRDPAMVPIMWGASEFGCLSSPILYLHEALGELIWQFGMRFYQYVQYLHFMPADWSYRCPVPVSGEYRGLNGAQGEERGGEGRRGEANKFLLIEKKW